MIAGRSWLELVAAAQGLFYLCGAGWALIDIETFEAVTGPKVDEWLVKTVALLLLVSGGLFLTAAWHRHVPCEIVALAVGDAVALTSIDVVYVALQRISPIYLLDGLAHVMLLIGWGIALWKRELPRLMETIAVKNFGLGARD